MADPFNVALSLLGISNIGIKIVASITKYLSTLPHPIDTIEELVAVCSVISNLLKTLDSTVTRFLPSPTSPRPAFVQPLCHDISNALSYFAQKMKEAQELKVFEPSPIGLVKLPRHAWAFVMGGETPMGQFRSRLYVEKYRVRVLIDAVAWQGLRGIGVVGRTEEQERELQRLRKMLPLVAERLFGVWRDYQPRIEIREVRSTLRVSQPMAQQKTTIVAQVQKESAGEDLKESKTSTEKLGFYNSPSTSTLASTCSSFSTSSTLTTEKNILINNPNIIYERWHLRFHGPTRTLKTSTTLFGISLTRTHDYTPSYHYLKPVPSDLSEISSMLHHQLSSGVSVEQNIQCMPKTAKCEIERLLEKREGATSVACGKCNFEVVAVEAQQRRTIAFEAAGGRRKFFWRKNMEVPMEWIILIKGEMLDRRSRVMPVKGEDPWNPRPKVVVPGPRLVMSPAQMQMHQQQQQQQMAMARMAAARNMNGHGPVQGAHVLRHVEQRRGISIEEAEKRMDEVFRDLFREPKTKGETRGVKNGNTDSGEAELEIERESPN